MAELGSHDEDQCFLAEGFEFSFILADPIGLVTDNSKPSMVNGSCICGPMTRPIRMRPTGRVELLGVCFRPGGAYPFFPCPANDLVNGSVEVDDLWGSSGSRVVERVRDGCHTMEERIQVLDRHFLHYLDKGRRSDSRVAAALSMASSEYLSTKADPGAKNPLRASVYTGITYLVTVGALIAPYLIFTNYFVSLTATLIIGILIIFMFNYYASVAKDLPLAKQFAEMAGLSLGVAGLSFLIGCLLRVFLGVDV